MVRPLAERLEPGSPALAAFVESLPHVEYRRSLTRRYKPRTVEEYDRRYRRYVEWCGMLGYQAEPQFITTDKVREFTEHMCAFLNYVPSVVWQGIRALQVYAEGAGVEISSEPARAVLARWRTTVDELESQGMIAPR